MPKITKDTTIADVLEINKGTAPIFISAGMHCLGCPSASNESIEQACLVHGIDTDTLVDELNKFLS